MADTWVLPTAVHALANAGVEILGLHKCMRQVDIQFVIEEDDFEKAVCSLHQNLVEGGGQQ
jgi:aspartate kinase